MESALSKVRVQLQSTVHYLTPLLPFANSHMVEFFTQNHWDKILPKALREYLEPLELNEAVLKFWSCFEPGCDSDTSELHKWVHQARSHYITTNDDYCLTVDQLKDRIKKWGGNVTPEVRLKDFMTSKKSYEVGIMSALTAAICSTRGMSGCLEVGGGRGYLLAALNVAYNMPVLTVDCDNKLLDAAKKRAHVVQKQWRAAVKTVQNDKEAKPDQLYAPEHKFACAFITSDTDVAAIVRENFPELSSKARILLTGLHTCGNLGPDSLRIFLAQPSVAAVFNVPCCYHLLTEEVDVQLFDFFKNEYGDEAVGSHGFPMSEELRGYNLGRNARMLAAQSVDRVVHLKQLPAISLLHRALLQIIIKKRLPDQNISEGKLKRVSSKCNTFKDYFKMADQILQLNLFDKMTEVEFNELCEDIEMQWKKLVLFYFVRLCIAQVIESVILLDRLLFMLENGGKEVFLVKLFDPVMSPRCHAILALR